MALEEMEWEQQRTPNPRRRRRSQEQIIKETYLPAIIAGAALIMIVIFIVGSINRAVSVRKAKEDASVSASQSEAQERLRLEAEAQDILARAADYAENYDYTQAISTIDSFSGTVSEFDALVQARKDYQDAQNNLVAIDDPNQVVNLSFHMLLANPERSFQDEEYGSSFNRNYVTVGEFSKILQQLYDNGYVLVTPDQIMTMTTGDDGTASYTAATLYLPSGKKPLILTQTNVNYNRYLVDSDEDGLADGGGKGFASRLVVDSSGSVKAEFIQEDGTAVTGDYDLVPILDAFIKEHPDFSYRGARAVLALTGYDGVLGYRTDGSVKEDQEFYDQQVQGAREVIQALKAEGYLFACYTYENVAYGAYSADEIQSDLDQWVEEVRPLVGDTDILVYAQNSEISDYSGDVYDILKGAGFNRFIGFCSTGTPWISFHADYVRQGRIMVNGSAMAYSGDLFTGLFDPSTVLDMTTRVEVPE